MADGVELVMSLTIDDGVLSTSEFKQAAKKAITNVVPDMQKIMYQVTPVGNAYDNDKHPGRLRESWVKPVDGLPTYRVTSRKNGDFGVFLYNNAKDQAGRKYVKWVNNGHESFNQYGGPFVTYNGTTWVNGKFFIERGTNRIKNDTSITDKIAVNITKDLNKRGK